MDAEKKKRPALLWPHGGHCFESSTVLSSVEPHRQAGRGTPFRTCRMQSVSHRVYSTKRRSLASKRKRIEVREDGSLAL